MTLSLVRRLAWCTGAVLSGRVLRAGTLGARLRSTGTKRRAAALGWCSGHPGVPPQARGLDPPGLLLVSQVLGEAIWERVEPPKGRHRVAGRSSSTPRPRACNRAVPTLRRSSSSRDPWRSRAQSWLRSCRTAAPTGLLQRSRHRCGPQGRAECPADPRHLEGACKHLVGTDRSCHRVVMSGLPGVSVGALPDLLGPNG